jgi:hypothetical protein
MTTATAIIAADPEAAKRRTLALNYAVDQTRRASSAVAAAACDEPDALRFAVLETAQRELCSLLARLRSLT